MGSKFNLASLPKLLSTKALNSSNTGLNSSNTGLNLSKHEIHKNGQFIELLNSSNNPLGAIIEFMAIQGQHMQISLRLSIGRDRTIINDKKVSGLVFYVFYQNLHALS